MSFATTKLLAPSHSLQSRFLYALWMGWNGSLSFPIFGFIYGLYVVLIETGNKQIFVYTYTCRLCVCKWCVNRRDVSIDMLTVLILPSWNIFPFICPLQFISSIYYHFLVYRFFMSWITFISRYFIFWYNLKSSCFLKFYPWYFGVCTASVFYF